MSVPYAHLEYDDDPRRQGGWLKVCPECGVRVPLKERKDFESFTGREYVEHYEQSHRSEPIQVNGHWYIDGIYGYGYDQRICTDHPSGNGTCLGIRGDDDEGR